MKNAKKIGLLVGREWSFPPALIEEIHNRQVDVVAEYTLLGGTQAGEACAYALLLDRISPQISYYRAYVQNAALQGVKVINDPFLPSKAGHFVTASLAMQLGLATPRTIALPLKEYPESIDSESLRNLVYPLDWEALCAHVGFPAWLSVDHMTAGAEQETPAYLVHSMDELLHIYDQSGQQFMVLRQHVAWSHQIRCLCVGRKQIQPMLYERPDATSPSASITISDADIPPDLYTEVIEKAHTLNQTLGYDLNEIDFALHQDVLYLLNASNPVPDLDINHLTPRNFEWAVRTVADYVVECMVDSRR